MSARPRADGIAVDLEQARQAADRRVDADHHGRLVEADGQRRRAPGQRLAHDRAGEARGRRVRARRAARPRSAAAPSGRRGSPCASRRRRAARASPWWRRRWSAASAACRRRPVPSASSPPNVASELVNTSRGAPPCARQASTSARPPSRLTFERRVEVALRAAAHDRGEMDDRHLRAVERARGAAPRRGCRRAARSHPPGRRAGRAPWARRAGAARPRVSSCADDARARCRAFPDRP